jgi:hypothetical protein
VEQKVLVYLSSGDEGGPYQTNFFVYLSSRDNGVPLGNRKFLCTCHHATSVDVVEQKFLLTCHHVCAIMYDGDEVTAKTAITLTTDHDCNVKLSTKRQHQEITPSTGQDKEALLVSGNGHKGGDIAHVQPLDVLLQPAASNSNSTRQFDALTTTSTISTTAFMKRDDDNDLGRSIVGAPVGELSGLAVGGRDLTFVCLFLFCVDGMSSVGTFVCLFLFCVDGMSSVGICGNLTGSMGAMDSSLFLSSLTSLMESSLIRSSPNSSAPSMGHQSIPKKVLHLGTEVHKTKIHGASGFDVSSIHGNKTARNITLVSRKKGNERLLENISLFANLKCITGVAFLMNSFMSTTGPNSEGSTPT